MPNRALHRFAFFSAAATFLLLGAGGLVTSHGVGMAVPDWPNTYGYNMFFFPISEWVGGVFYEHTHRLLASGVGLCTSILTVWLYGRPARRFLRGLGIVLLLMAAFTLLLARSRWEDALVLAGSGLAAMVASLAWPRCEPAAPWLRKLGLAAFLAVVLQGVLGGLRVVLFKDQIGIFHATLAQLFFALMCSLALFTSPWWQRRFGFSWRPSDRVEKPDREARAPLSTSFEKLLWLCAALTVLILIQLALGATMRHQHAGLSIPDFPTAYGKLWPAIDAQSVARYNQQRIEVVDLNPITAAQIVLQMVHRLIALSILVGVACFAWLARRARGAPITIARLGLVWLCFIGFQAFLGAATIWSHKAADIATAHVLVGALSLALGAISSLILFQEKSQRVAAVAVVRPVPLNPGQAFVPHPSPASGN